MTIQEWEELRALADEWRDDAAKLGPFIAEYTKAEDWELESACRAERRAMEDCATELERLLERSK